jgi:phage anti-repressor protein
MGGSGMNKEQIMLTVNTFKKFCLKANTKKADEIHDYYIKLEELLHETVEEETNERDRNRSEENKKKKECK